MQACHVERGGQARALYKPDTTWKRLPLSVMGDAGWVPDTLKHVGVNRAASDIMCTSKRSLLKFNPF